MKIVTLLVRFTLFPSSQVFLSGIKIGAFELLRRNLLVL